MSTTPSAIRHPAGHPSKFAPANVEVLNPLPYWDVMTGAGG
ncbi:hypothetical protein OKW33_006758 [Paraburkholderia atlantica]|uniref:Uncharacterized protein n=1 Tax=Paraburkholderia atlantica TaxID=2654982 RepID=D5WML0_PARAM|nr:hypothetical protein [Paraburkholderia atlantica]ADG20456.1 hypothetical protein BC1002_6615 [Paraburkholderia atlantica]MBB5426826.1 hypothetical protein [Paraburkholderia atlantica]MBB5510161.1 hypothetical protein [Paraburkholderia atlantica]